jgi:GTP-binding protein HflX
VNGVLKDLDAQGKQTLLVFNKVDALENPDIVEAYRNRFPRSVAISARTGEGVSTLVRAFEDLLDAWRMRSRFHVPANEQALIAEVHRVGHVLDVQYEGDVAVITAHIPPQLEPRLAPFAEK